MRQDAQTQHSQISDTIWPTCEDSSAVQIKIEPMEPNGFNFPRADSPDTLLNQDENDVFFDAVSVAMLTPEPSAAPGFLAQLIAAAESECSTPNTPYPEPYPPQVTLTSTDDVAYLDYDSQKTDFKEDTPSPSVCKTERKRAPATRKKSHRLQRKSQSSSKSLPVRRLNLSGRISKQSTKNIKKSANVLALKNLQDLERARSHRWDEDERELLCVLHRWYCAADRATELTVFSKTFNSITGLDLRPHIVRNHFEYHLRMYGGEAYPEYNRVFSVPFDDPKGRYMEIRALIEAEAKGLNLDLQQRRCDVEAISGWAKSAKSLRTRSIYGYLVQKASQEAEWETARASVAHDVPVATQSIATIAMAVSVPLEDEWEMVTDADLSLGPVTDSVKVLRTTSAMPHLTFRVWDASNRTRFVDGSFVAQTFVDWPRPFPNPIALDDPSEAGKILTVLHLSKKGDTPVYISTASVSSTRSILEILLILCSHCYRYCRTQ